MLFSYSDGGIFFQAEDGIRDLVRSRGLGDVYKRQLSIWRVIFSSTTMASSTTIPIAIESEVSEITLIAVSYTHLTLPTISSV